MGNIIRNTTRNFNAVARGPGKYQILESGPYYLQKKDVGSFFIVDTTVNDIEIFLPVGPEFYNYSFKILKVSENNKITLTTLYPETIYGSQQYVITGKFENLTFFDYKGEWINLTRTDFFADAEKFVVREKVTPGVNFKNLSETSILIAEENEVLPLRLRIKPTSSFGLTSGPTISVGTNPARDNIILPSIVTGLTATNLSFIYNIEGISNIVYKGETVFLKVVNTATASSLIGTVDFVYEYNNE